MDDLRLERLSMNELESIKELFRSVFTAEPWCDDWSDDAQLTMYITDLAGQSCSLTYGLYRGDELVGLTMGHIRHWFRGTEYYIDEFCIRTDLQGQGLGSAMLKLVKQSLAEMDIHSIFLQTERTMPAYKFYLAHGFTELCDHVSFYCKF